jgi:hypothetical protein
MLRRDDGSWSSDDFKRVSLIYCDISSNASRLPAASLQAASSLVASV